MCTHICNPSRRSSRGGDGQPGISQPDVCVFFASILLPKLQQILLIGGSLLILITYPCGPPVPSLVLRAP